MIFKYRFDLGDSDGGPVGLCFDVVLEQERCNRKAALKKAIDVLSEFDQDPIVINMPPFKHVCVYVNKHHLKLSHIVNIMKYEKQ